LAGEESVGDLVGKASGAVRKSARKATKSAKESANKSATSTVKRTARTARKAAATAREAAQEASTTVADSAEEAGTAVADKARQAVATVKATRKARAGLVDDARRIADDADLDEGMATKAIERAEALHYDVVVNKRGLSVTALTTTLNERWDNGWRLAHVFEQRGNTVLVFEKRD
jgi:hypothetical protein